MGGKVQLAGLSELRKAALLLAARQQEEIWKLWQFVPLIMPSSFQSAAYPLA